MKRPLALLLALALIFLAAIAFAQTVYHPRSKEVTVTTAGTAVALSSTSIKTPSALVRAHSANTGDIYIGTSAVTAEGGWDAGMYLEPGDSLSLDEIAGAAKYGTMIDLSNWYINSAYNSESVRLIWLHAG